MWLDNKSPVCMGETRGYSALSRGKQGVIALYLEGNKGL